jgi:hypothetical protein
MYGELSGGNQWRRGERKSYPAVKDEGNGSMPHIYIGREHNENHQALFKREGKGRGGWEYNGGMNLFKVPCTSVKLSQ